ncbi:MAG: ActS/PrrB/RegB family redox-sensitive histidine kinase [Bauldia sp.]
MALATTEGPTERGEERRVRLNTLVKLRWLAVAGQTAAVVVVGSLFGFPEALLLCLVPIGISAALNFYLRVRYPQNLRLRDRAAAAVLAFDLVELGVLLFLTGGLENPFSVLVLVPVMVSATTLTARHTQILGAIALAMTALLAAYHLPLPWSSEAPIGFPPIYVAGLWLAMAICLGFMSLYAFRVTEEARQLADALAATELAYAREQHLFALDGLAAAAAHALGTPLATITVVAKELARELAPGTPHGDDVALLVSQAERCREVLAKLNSLSTVGEWHLARLPISQLVAEVVEPQLEFGVAIQMMVSAEGGNEPVGTHDPAIVYGLGNLLENAVDFAATTVTVTAAWTNEDATITIADDGPGFAADILDQLGEPYLTTRAKRMDAGATDAAGGGLGLGFFIAKTLLERSGARLTLFNRQPPQSGAVVRVRWPRRALERPDTIPANGELPRSARSWRRPAELL